MITCSILMSTKKLKSLACVTLPTAGNSWTENSTFVQPLIQFDPFLIQRFFIDFTLYSSSSPLISICFFQNCNFHIVSRLFRIIVHKFKMYTIHLFTHQLATEAFLYLLFLVDILPLQDVAFCKWHGSQLTE